MIEIKRDKTSKYDNAGLLYIDGNLMENAHVYFADEKSCKITVKNEEASKRIAAYSLSEFPLLVNQITLRYFPNDLEHTNNVNGVFISMDYEDGQPTNNYTAFMEFGGESLSGWNAFYTFAQYAKEMFRLLKQRGDIVDVTLQNINHDWLNRKRDEAAHTPRYIPISLDQIDESRIHSLGVEFLYGSVETKIADELGRIFNILRELNKEAIRSLRTRIHNIPIKIKKKANPEKSGDTRPYIYELFIDGDPIKDVDVNKISRDNKALYTLSTHGQISFKILTSYPLAQLPRNIDSLFLSLSFEPIELFNYISISKYRRGKAYKASFNCMFDSGQWNGKYSLKEYRKELYDIIKETRNPDINFEFIDIRELLDSAFLIEFLSISTTTRIIDEIIRYSYIVREFIRKAEIVLASRPPINDSISMSFDFPKEIQTSCQQYLLYFGQFLRDLGVEANTTLVQDAGKVLFTVTPIGKAEALHKIHTALNYYLDLPTSPVGDAGNEIAHLRLESTVHRLQSDFKLAAAEIRSQKAEIESKNTTIESQRLIINVQKSLLSGEIFKNSMKEVTSKEKDKEQFLGGTVALVPIEGKGVQINIPEIFRRLRQMFKDEDKEPSE